MEWAGRAVLERQLWEADVLEVGSLNVNGSVRQFFCGPYLGVDIRHGPGVDEISAAEHLPYRDGRFDVVVSTEMLEHCLDPWQAMFHMSRVLKVGGVLLLSCRGFDERGCWPVHHDPVDRWRFSGQAVRDLCGGNMLKVFELEADPDGPGWLVTALR